MSPNFFGQLALVPSAYFLTALLAACLLACVSLLGEALALRQMRREVYKAVPLVRAMRLARHGAFAFNLAFLGLAFSTDFGMTLTFALQGTLVSFVIVYGPLGLAPGSPLRKGFPLHLSAAVVATAFGLMLAKPTHWVLPDWAYFACFAMLLCSWAAREFRIQQDILRWRD